MPTRLVTVAALVAAGCVSVVAPARAAVLFFGGDIAVGNSTPSYAPNGEQGGTFDRTYTSFTIPAGQSWRVESLYAYMVFQDPNTLTNVTASRIEFRSGLSEGDAGANVALATNRPVTVTDTGIKAIFNLYDVALVEAALAAPIELPSGEYWVAFTPETVAVTRLLMGTTFGANAVNASPGNDFRNSNFFSLNYAVTTLEPSLGIRGQIIPAPAVFSAIPPLAVIAFRRRRVG